MRRREEIQQLLMEVFTMAMEVVTLRTNQRCQECGKELPKGSQVRMYRRSDGSVLFYCLDGHPQRDNRTVTNRGNRTSRGVPPSANLSEVVSILSEILKTLQDIRSDIKALLAERVITQHPENLVEDDEVTESNEDDDEFPF